MVRFPRLLDLLRRGARGGPIPVGGGLRLIRGSNYLRYIVRGGSYTPPPGIGQSRKSGETRGDGPKAYDDRGGAGVGGELQRSPTAYLARRRPPPTELGQRERHAVKSLIR